jgi:hypothetical protein
VSKRHERLQARCAQTDQRERLVESLVWQVEDAKMSVQLAKELQAFASFAQFQRLAEQAVTLGKQSWGWWKRARSAVQVASREILASEFGDRVVQSAPISRPVRTGRTVRGLIGNRYPGTWSPNMKCLAAPMLFLALAVVSPLARAVDCQNNIPPSNPDIAYQTHAGGTVTDTRSGLVWKRCSEGQSWTGSACSGTASGHAWSQALALAEASTFAGYGDWRLPNIKELTSLVEECRSLPAINNTLFPNTASSYFWSGSPVADYSSGAWGVDFEYGYAWNIDFNRSDALQVRLVRGVQ